MIWAEVLADKSLQDLPYKIELNGRGQIVMSPASNRHGLYQSEIVRHFHRLARLGRVITECSVQTADGVKVADVAWMSSAFAKKHGLVTPYRTAPEICVEVVSPSNTKMEIDEKITLYLAKGAQEMWVCDSHGQMTFHDHSGELAKSKVFPRFPNKIEY
ncbi:MAG: Uma2 family endonuclease [Planctomycetia bacterium]|nr:Uma2 family endonuclease [Planctomycetia bacterium]